LILACNVGKFRLWAGQPFLALTRLDAEAGDVRALGREVRNGVITTSERPVVTLRPSSSDQPELCPSYLPDNLPPGVIALDTTSIPSGAYELGVALRSQKVWIPENVWILDRASYREMLVEESREQFARLPYISNKAELDETFRSIILSNWSELLWPNELISLKTSFLSQTPVPTAVVEWITRTILDTFHYISIFGVRNSVGLVVIDDNHLEVAVEAGLDYPLPSAVIRSLNDRDCSDLHVLNKSMDREDFREEFNVDLSVEHLKARIAVKRTERVFELASR
jgi:hypothetical protein